MPASSRRMGTCDLALGLHQPGEAGRRYPERQRDLVPQHGAAGVHLARRPAGSSGETRCRGTPVGRGPVTARPRRRRRCSRTPLSACGAWRFGVDPRWSARTRAGASSHSVAVYGTAAAAPVRWAGARVASSRQRLAVRSGQRPPEMVRRSSIARRSLDWMLIPDSTRRRRLRDFGAGTCSTEDSGSVVVVIESRTLACETCQ